MRTLVDIPELQLKELARVSKAEKRSRAAIIRDAIAAYLEKHKPKANSSAFDDAFGLWKDKNIDGVEYQRKLRDEW
jgi:hypothetical protein